MAKGNTLSMLKSVCLNKITVLSDIFFFSKVFYHLHMLVPLNGSLGLKCIFHAVENISCVSNEEFKKKVK